MSISVCTIVEGDLTRFKCDVIIHQSNTVLRRSHKSAGLAKALFKRYPYCNIYKQPSTQASAIPGEIVIRRPFRGSTGPTIIAINGQDSLGRSKTEAERNKRFGWFKEGLEKVTRYLSSSEIQRKSLITIAIPYNIGCGLAGGHWPVYFEHIQRWSQSLPSNCLVKIVRL
ncbi:hypothetical protein P9112_000250 [Eukaryota sp. TZLM1-RC]